MSIGGGGISSIVSSSLGKITSRAGNGDSKKRKGADVNGRGGEMDHVKQWEEELERMENAAKRSSQDMLAFFGLARKSRRKESAKDL